MKWLIVEDALRDRKGHWLEYVSTFVRGLTALGDIIVRRLPRLSQLDLSQNWTSDEEAEAFAHMLVYGYPLQAQEADAQHRCHIPDRRPCACEAPWT